MSKIQIVLNGHEDRVSIADLLSSFGKYEIEVVNNYNFNGSETYPLDLGTLDGTELEAFYTVLDLASYPIEANALIWKIKRYRKGFDLSSSFIRKHGELLQINNGVQLKMRVEIPGFETNEYQEIDLWFNENFNPADLDLLKEIGIGIEGNGSAFTISNATVCNVSFKMPSGATSVYIIDDVNSSLVIPV